MAISVFTDQVPSSPNNSDGTPAITLADAIRIDADGSITGIRFYSTTTIGGTYSAILWVLSAPVAGTKQAIGPGGALFQDFPGTPDSGGWNVIEFDTPVPVSAGTVVLAAYRNSEGRYAASPGIFSNAPVNTTGIVNGPLTALGVQQEVPEFGGAIVFNNRFYIGTDSPADMGIPTEYFNGGNYFVDIVFEPAGEGPSEGSAALGLDLALSSTGSADAEGTAALGLDLAVAATGSAPAEGTAALGLNLAVAATGERDSLGTAALGLNLAVAATGLRNSSGSAALGLNLAVAATGSNGDSGRPVTPWPYGSRPVSSFPWAARPVKSFEEVET